MNFQLQVYWSGGETVSDFNQDITHDKFQTSKTIFIAADMEMERLKEG